MSEGNQFYQLFKAGQQNRAAMMTAMYPVQSSQPAMRNTNFYSVPGCNGSNTKIVTENCVEMSGNTVINISGVFINDCSGGGTYDCSGGNYNITDLSCNSVTTKSLKVLGDSSLNGNLRIGGDLIVNGQKVVPGATVTTTDGSFDHLFVNNGSVLNGGAVVSGDLTSISSKKTTIDSSLSVLRDASFNTNLSVAGNLWVNGKQIVPGTTTPTADPNFSSLTVSGTTNLNGVTNMNGSATNINNSGIVSVTGTTFNVNAPVTMKQTLDVSGNTIIRGKNLIGYGDGSSKTSTYALDVSGSVNVTGKYLVNGKDITTGTGTGTVSGDITVNSVTTNTVQGASSGDMSITSNSVLKMQSLNSNIDITAAGAVGIWPKGYVNIAPTTGNVNINPTVGEVWIYPNNTVHIEPSGGIVLNAKGNGSNVDIGATKDVNIWPKGNVNVNPTGDATINPYGTVRITSQKGKDILINDDRTNWYSSADTGSGLGDVHFNLGSTKSNVYVDNGSLVVGYGNGVKKTSAYSLDVSGGVNIIGKCLVNGKDISTGTGTGTGTGTVSGDITVNSVTTNTITNSGDSSNPTISIKSKNSTVGGACYTNIGFDSNNTGTLYLNPNNLKGSCVVVNSGCKDPTSGLVSEWTNLCVDNGNFVVNSGSAIIGYGDYGGHHKSSHSLDVSGNVNFTGSLYRNNSLLSFPCSKIFTYADMTNGDGTYTFNVPKGVFVTSILCVGGGAGGGVGKNGQSCGGGGGGFAYACGLSLTQTNILLGVGTGGKGYMATTDSGTANVQGNNTWIKIQYYNQYSDFYITGFGGGQGGDTRSSGWGGFQSGVVEDGTYFSTGNGGWGAMSGCDNGNANSSGNGAPGKYGGNGGGRSDTDSNDTYNNNNKDLSGQITCAGNGGGVTGSYGVVYTSSSQDKAIMNASTQLIGYINGIGNCASGGGGGVLIPGNGSAPSVSVAGNGALGGGGGGGHSGSVTGGNGGDGYIIITCV